MKFRTVILFGILAVVAGILVASSVAVSRILEASTRDRLAHELATSRTILGEVQLARQRTLRSEARVVAGEPRLKAATAAEDISHATIVGVADEMRKALGSDLFLLTDADGVLLVDAKDPEAEGFDLSDKPVITKALKNGQAAAVWTEGDTVYQVQTQRLAFGAEVVGVLLVGYVIDDAFMQAIQRQTEGLVALELDEKVVAHALGDIRLGGAAASIPLEGVAEVDLGGVRYLGTSLPVPGYAGERKARYVLLESLDAALEPAKRLQRTIYGIAGAALVLAALLAFLISARLSRPLDSLVTFTKKVGGDDLAARAPTEGPLEVRSLAEAMNSMVQELAASRDQLAAKERLEQEMEIAERVQTSILPKTLDIEGLEIAARMVTASEVGGDYYDVVPTDDGAWIGVGDVAGHGLPAGLVMLMLQSGVAGLVRAQPDAKPSAIVSVLNRIIHENVRVRLDQDEHVTFCLLRYEKRGRITFAGAHETVLVWRAADERIEELDTPGTWLGTLDDIESFTPDTSHELHPGDVVLLYTDGLTEAASKAGEHFEIDRMREVFEKSCDRPAEAICDAILERVTDWTHEQTDDMTLLVFRYRGD